MRLKKIPMNLSKLEAKFIFMLQPSYGHMENLNVHYIALCPSRNFIHGPSVVSNYTFQIQPQEEYELDLKCVQVCEYEYVAWGYLAEDRV
jgi:hypothetical protein